jgi:hypothetical protein
MFLCGSSHCDDKGVAEAGMVFRDLSDVSARKMAARVTTAPPRPSVALSPMISPATPETSGVQ